MSALTSDSPAPVVAAAREKPLKPAARFFLATGAVLTIACFYLFAILSMLVLALLLVVEGLMFVACLRFAIVGPILGMLRRHAQLLGLFGRSLWISHRSRFQVPLEESDAPALFARLRNLSDRIGVPAPREVCVEMNAGAWIRLKGMGRRSATTLGLGYDLIAALTVAELDAVLAHELTHVHLVHRGINHWLVGGVNRAATLSSSLSALAEGYRAAHRARFALAHTWVTPADRIARLAARLFAAYSRQDEFDADAGAAALCGAAPLCRGLTKLDTLSYRTSRIAWNERVVRLQEGSFGAWIAAELASDAAAPSAGRAKFDRYSTHPSTHDRVAALPVDSSPTTASPAAIELLADPDGIAARLVEEIHRVLKREEDKDTRSLRKWLRRMRAGGKIRLGQWAGLVLGLGGLAMGFVTWVGGRSTSGAAISAAAIVGGIVMIRYLGFRDRRILPVPSFETIEAQWEQILNSREQKLRAEQLTDEIDLGLSNLTQPERCDYIFGEAYAALRECDYLRAQIAAQAALKRNLVEIEMTMVMAIAAAGLRQGDTARAMLAAFHRETRFKTPCSLWAGAWTFVLLGHWLEAEAMLSHAHALDPQEAAFPALLAYVQKSRNKLQSAVANARKALAADPRSRPRRLLLVDLLIQSGQLREARELVDLRPPGAPVDVATQIASVRINLLRREFAEVEQALEKLRSNGVAPQQKLQLAVACELARCDDHASGLYRTVLSEGYFPVAHLGLARLAAHGLDKAAARKHILASLNTKQTLHERAVGSLELMGVAMSQLLELEDPIPDARAWIATFPVDPSAGTFARSSFLIFAPHAEAAAEYLHEVNTALRPDEPPRLPNYFTWKRAPRDRQPAGAVRPGVQYCWKN